MAENNINIRLHGIELISFGFIPRPLEGFEGKNYNFKYNIDNSVDYQRKLIVSMVKVDVSEAGKELTLATIIVGCGVEVKNFDEVIKTTSGNLPDVPDNLDLVVRTVAISTTRGIMFAEFKGTYLHGAMLPIVLQSANQINEGQDVSQPAKFARQD